MKERRGRIVECTVCGRTKAPVGRSLPMGSAPGYCTFECEGYYDDPKPDYLFPTETESDFGYGGTA